MTSTNTTWRRSRDRMIGGVCAGIAEHLGWSADRVRVAYVILTILSAAFPGLIVYLVLWFVMPGPEEGPVNAGPR
jgi:phage shock protein C